MSRFRKSTWVAIGVLVLLFVIGWLVSRAFLQPAPEPVIVKETVIVETIVKKLVEVEVVAPALQASVPPIKYSVALDEVKARFPASRYMTNEFLPTAEDLAHIEAGPRREVELGAAWILNDEQIAEYIGEEEGYYEEEGLVVTLHPGGTGTNNFQLLGVGKRDIAIVSMGRSIPFAVASRTPMDVVAVGTFLKWSPFCYITALPEKQGRDLTPLDLIGYKVGYGQPGDPVFIHMLLDKWGIPRESVKYATNDWNILGSLKAGVDFYPGWRMNQTRYLDRWNTLMYKDWVYNEPTAVYAVRRETLETPEGRDMVRRFLRATYRGIQYHLDNPEKAAEIALKYAQEGSITYEMALERFRIQRDYVIGSDSLGLMAMDPEVWDNVVAVSYQYGEIELP